MMDKLDLEAILKAHQLWLNNDPEGKQADLSNADLSGTRLSNV